MNVDEVKRAALALAHAEGDLEAARELLARAKQAEVDASNEFRRALVRVTHREDEVAAARAALENLLRPDVGARTDGDQEDTRQWDDAPA
jgi:hypothetical protein